MPVGQNNFFIFSKAIIAERHSLAMVISSLTLVWAVVTGVNERGRYLVLANICMGSVGKNEAYSMGEGGKSTGCETFSAFWQSQGGIIGWRREKYHSTCDAI